MNDFEELRKIIATMLNWWWVIVTATIMGALIGYTVSQWQSPVYEATTTLLIGQSIQSTELDTRDMLASEQLALT